MTDSANRFRTDRRSPFMDAMGIRVVIEADAPVVRVDLNEVHLRSHNIAHGGLLCAVLDTAMGATAYASMASRKDDAVDPSSGVELVTSQLTIHFIRPAWNGESIVGSGEILHHGAKTIVVRGEVRTEAGVVVAAGSGTFLPVAISESPRSD